MEKGTYAYGLNVVLPANFTNYIATNSKRVERDFRLTSIQCALSGSTTFDDGLSFILGTEQQNWFSDFIICSLIFGDAALPHFLPGQGTVILAGDYIVANVKNLNTVDKWVSLLFQGEHI